MATFDYCRLRYARFMLQQCTNWSNLKVKVHRSSKCQCRTTSSSRYHQHIRTFASFSLSSGNFSDEQYHQPNKAKLLRSPVPHNPNGNALLQQSSYSSTSTSWYLKEKLSKSKSSSLKLLGIETSCDDTGAAIVDGHGNIIGDAIHQQTTTHLQSGGIIPNVAKEMHAENIEHVVDKALRNADMDLMDVDGIAVTVEPGLAMSLRVGLTHAQKLSHISGKPLIPIHHMEAHALTARMTNKIDFPFVVLLTSGGHCLLAVARDVEEFLLLGTTMDDAPGEAFDKTARELKLNTLPGFEAVCGGAAVEKMAQSGDPHAFPQVHVMTTRANCNFSFTGLKIAARTKIREEYKRQGLVETEVLPNAADICAWFQYNVMYHLARRLQRAFIFTDLQNLVTSKRSLVMSGGVASNQYIRHCLSQVCEMYDYQLICPPPHLCTDNGIMIAWNGVEKVLACVDCFSQDPYSLRVQPRSPFGTDISSKVANTFIKLPKLKINK